jgi:hypothetical protein
MAKSNGKTKRGQKPTPLLTDKYLEHSAEHLGSSEFVPVPSIDNAEDIPDAIEDLCEWLRVAALLAEWNVENKLQQHISLDVATTLSAIAATLRDGHRRQVKRSRGDREVASQFIRAARFLGDSADTKALPYLNLLLMTAGELALDAGRKK